MPKLLKRTVDAIKGEPGTDFIVWDDELKGFGLRVRNGRKIYILQYRDTAGATRRVLIGEHGSYTPERARAEATGQRAMVLAARRDPTLADPATNRRKAKLAAKTKLLAPTVAELADEFLAHADGKLKKSTAGEYRRLLGITEIRNGPSKGKPRIGELRRALGRFKVEEVTRGQIAKLHLSMKDRPYMANRALSAMSALFSYAKLQGYRDDPENPCKGIQEFKEKKRERYLTDAEYAALGDALRRAEKEGLPSPPDKLRRRATEETAKHRSKKFGALKQANPIGVAVIRFLLLTGWREGEALNLRWTEVNFDRGSVTLPDTKTGKSERELGAPAVLLLSDLKKIRRRDNLFVFYGSKSNSHFTDTARVWNCVRHAAGLADVRIHDLRHGYASVGLASGLTLPVIGSLLGHSDVATTARYAHLADSARKRAADLTASAIATALNSNIDSTSQLALEA